MKTAAYVDVTAVAEARKPNSMTNALQATADAAVRMIADGRMGEEERRHMLSAWVPIANTATDAADEATRVNDSHRNVWDTTVWNIESRASSDMMGACNLHRNNIFEKERNAH